MDCSLPGSSIHGIFQARVLEWGAIAFSIHWDPSKHKKKFAGGSEVKVSAYKVGDLGLTPGSGRSPGEGNGNPLQYSCLENPMNGGAWWATVNGVAKRWTRLSDFTFTMAM